MSDDAAERARLAMERIRNRQVENTDNTNQRLAEGRAFVQPITEFLKALRSNFQSHEHRSIRIDDGLNDQGEYVVSYEFANQADSADLVLKITPVFGSDPFILNVHNVSLKMLMPAKTYANGYSSKDVPQLLERIENAVIDFFAAS